MKQVSRQYLPKLDLISSALRNPFTIACILCLGYLYLFQRPFLLSGDFWAETHAEYLTKAIGLGWEAVFQSGWAGYWGVFPSLISKTYVSLGFPIGYADYFFQIATVTFAVTSAAFIAHPWNRKLIKSDLWRYVIALLWVMILRDRATFSLINITYIGIMPLIIIGINPNKMSWLGQTGYSLFGSLVALTKPTIFLVPFVIYRAWRTKEYWSALAVLVAIGLQTVILLTSNSQSNVTAISRDIGQVFLAIISGSGVAILKVFQVESASLWQVICVNVPLLIAGIFVWKRYGSVPTILLVLTYVLSIYLYVLAPDAPVYHGLNSYQDMLIYNYKSQREYLTNALLVFSLATAGIGVGRWLEKEQGHQWQLASAVLAILIIRAVFAPINTESAGVAASADQFRSAMNRGEVVCAPLPPTPAYAPGRFPGGQWVFSYKASCTGDNYQLMVDYDGLLEPVNSTPVVSFINPTKDPLRTVYVVIRNGSPHISGQLTLQDVQTQLTYTAPILAHSTEAIYFIPFNLSGIEYRSEYSFVIRSSKDDIYLGKFIGTQIYTAFLLYAENIP